MRSFLLQRRPNISSVSMTNIIQWIEKGDRNKENLLGGPSEVKIELTPIDLK